jgi:hypothetical protein
MAIGVSKFTPTTSSNLSNFDQCRFENLGRGLAAVKSALYVALSHPFATQSQTKSNAVQSKYARGVAPDRVVYIQSKRSLVTATGRNLQKMCGSAAFARCCLVWVLSWHTFGASSLTFRRTDRLVSKQRSFACLPYKAPWPRQSLPEQTEEIMVKPHFLTAPLSKYPNIFVLLAFQRT